MKVKIIKKVLISLLSTVLFVVILYSANHRHCYHFVEKLNYNCKGISDLNNYIDYNMLSSDLKNLYRKTNSAFRMPKKNISFAVWLAV